MCRKLCQYNMTGRTKCASIYNIRVNLYTSTTQCVSGLGICLLHIIIYHYHSSLFLACVFAIFYSSVFVVQCLVAVECTNRDSFKFKLLLNNHLDKYTFLSYCSFVAFAPVYCKIMVCHTSLYGNRFTLNIIESALGCYT